MSKRDWHSKPKFAENLMRSSERCRSNAMDWADELEGDRRKHLLDVYFDEKIPNSEAFEVFLLDGFGDTSWRTFHRQRTNILYLIGTVHMWVKDIPPLASSELFYGVKNPSFSSA